VKNEGFRGSLLAFARSTTIKNREVFDYEPTYSIIRKGKAVAVLILRQKSCILGKTFGSCLGCYSPAADCWLWLHGHGFAKLSKGPENFAAILHTMGVPAPHLMAWLTI